METRNLIKVDKRIEYFIRARYPITYIVSNEEGRVEKSIRKIAQARSKKLAVWSITSGFELDDGNRLTEFKDPIKAVDYIIKLDVNGIFILRDFHPFLNDPIVVRKMRDLYKELKVCLKNVIILSPILKIPPEMDKEIAVIDYDLPDKEDLRLIIQQIRSSLPEGQGKTESDEPDHEEKILDAALGLTAEEAENVFAKSLVQTGRFDIDIILSEKEQIIRKSGVLEFYKTSEHIQDIGGLENLKDWLNKRTRAFSHEAREFGLPQPKGIILIGIPGCGKSLTAKAISSLWQLPLLRLDVGRIFSSLVGSSEENVRKAIQTAESIAPAILWLDELEKGFSGVQSSGQTDGGTSARVFGTFLSWLQEKTSPVFVVATSNNVSALPPELLRKGRFDEIFYIDLPDINERKDIFKIHLDKRKRKPENFDLEHLAKISFGYSGSEIEQAVISGLYDAFDEGKELTSDHLCRSIEEMIPISKTMEDSITRIREWAETRARKASIENFIDEQEKVRQLEL